MLWAGINAEGVLTIRAEEPLERYALRRWQEDSAPFSKKLVLEFGFAHDIVSIAKLIGEDTAAYRRWCRRNEQGAVVEGLDDIDPGDKQCA